MQRYAEYRIPMSTSYPRPFRHPSFSGRIGVAQVDITPPAHVFSRNWGAARSDCADAVHRPLMLSAISLSSPSHREDLVMIEADLGGWRSAQAFSEFYSHLLEATSVSPENLIVAVSHTHAAPPLVDEYEAGKLGHSLSKWMSELLASTVRAVGEARNASVDATLDWHIGRCALATNRDLAYPLPSGQQTACGYNPYSRADDTLLLGRVCDSTGRILATLVNYACHPTTLAWDNSSISPDYVGEMRATVQQATGAPSLFLLGACGELAPRFQYVGDAPVADRHGKQLAFAVLATLHDMEPPRTQLAFDRVVESGAPLAVWKSEPCASSGALRGVQTSVDLPLKDWPTAMDLEEQLRACNDRMLRERLRRKSNVRRTVGDYSAFSLPIHAWRIGDAVLIGTACEAYSEIQIELRRQFPEYAIIVMNLINGTIAYLPPAELYDTDAYPVWQTPFERGGFEKTREEMLHTIRSILAS